MQITNPIYGKFLARPNRFIGQGEFNGKKLEFHIADPGRLTELLYPSNEIIIYKRDNPGKTKYSLILVKNNKSKYVLINTLFHSKIVREYLELNNIDYKAEVKYEDSRFDFLIDDTYIETKGCSLMIGNTGYFPDAPTLRGSKHVSHLTHIIKNGGKAEIWFLMANKVKKFSPQKKTDPVFAENFRRFVEIGGIVKFFDIVIDIKKDTAKFKIVRNKTISFSY